jgi:uncharacterized protein (DUF983 family)
MALKQVKRHFYGNNQGDIREMLTLYSKALHPVHHFANAVCHCGGILFQLYLDDTEGAAIRRCVACSQEHAFGDSADYPLTH